MSVASKVRPDMRFGRLRVVEDTSRRKWGQIVWGCLCDCGNEAHVVSAKLIRGQIVSCGCYRRELVREINRRTRDELAKKVAETVSKHGWRHKPIKQEVTWRTKLTLTCPRCGHKRHTDINAFLKNPAACRRCSKRIGGDYLRAILAKRMITLDRLEHPTEGGQGRAHCECQVCHRKFVRTVGELVSDPATAAVDIV